MLWLVLCKVIVVVLLKVVVVFKVVLKVLGMIILGKFEA